MRAAAPHHFGAHRPGRGPWQRRGRLLSGAVALAAVVAAIVLLALLVSGGGRGALNAVRAVTGGSSSEAQLTSVSRAAPIVYRPPGHGSAKLPLVVALYGFGGCPQCMEGVTGFERLAQQQGFVVAYPASTTNPPWNAPGDLAYLRSFIDQVIRTDGIDASRVYLTGFSAGGRAAYQYGCALSDKLAAVAIVSSVMRGYACPLRHPVSELAIVGSTEHAALYGNSNGIPSAASTAARWRRMNNCPAAITPRLSSAGAGGLVSQQLWGPCADGSRVALWVLSGGYHTWPGTSSARYPDSRFDASAAIWQFFSSVRASSLTRPDAALASVRGGSRVVASLRLGEPVTVHATLTRGAHTLASAGRSLGPGNASLSLGAGHGGGHGAGARLARLRLVIRDAYGRSVTIVRKVRVS